MQVGFQKDSKWMYSGSEDGTVKIWDMRAPGFQREYASRGAVNTVVLHPNQGELVSGKRLCLPRPDEVHCAFPRLWHVSQPLGAAVAMQVEALSSRIEGTQA